MCKDFYIELLRSEIRTNQGGASNKSDPYDMYDINNQLIGNKHSENFQEHFKIDVSQDKMFLPSIQLMPKLQKNVTKDSFIISSLVLSLKPLAKPITLFFKVIYRKKFLKMSLLL